MEKITSRDLLKFKYPENVRFSPDGRTLAYQLAFCDEKENNYRRDIWLYKDGINVKLTDDINAGILCWLDNENMLISQVRKPGEDSGSEILKININTHEKDVYFKSPLPLSGLKKVNDNVFVAVTTIDANDPDFYLDDEKTRNEKREKKKQDKDYEVLDEVPFWFNGAGFINKQREALFVIELDPFRITRITDPYFSCQNVLAEDGKVYFSGASYTSRSTMYAGIYSLDVVSREVKPVYDRLDYSIGNLFMMDGKLHCLASDMKIYGINETMKFCRVENNELTLVKDVDRSLYDGCACDIVLGSGQGSKAEKNFYYTLATDVDHLCLWRFNREFEHQQLFTAPLITCMDVKDGKIAFISADETSLLEVFMLDEKTGEYQKLTKHNSDTLKDKYVAKPQEIHYESNGLQLNGWVLLPENYDPEKKYPAVLDVHGGPRAVYTPVFFHEMQLWASEGYVVFFTNIRGSDGRGDEFADIRGKYGSVDYENLMDFTDEVLRRYPAIDERKVCVTGGSYGGFMTNWIIGHTDRFAAAASQRSIANWIGFTFISDISLEFGPDQNAVTDPIAQYDKLWDHSPLKYADNVKTPTLFIHSDEDYRCPLEEGIQMMQALLAKGVETRMVLFHGENHELSRGGKPLHRIRRLDEITGWFNKHVK